MSILITNRGFWRETLTNLKVWKSNKDMFNVLPGGASKNHGQLVPPHPDDSVT